MDSKGSTRRDEALAITKMRGKQHESLNYPKSPPLFNPLVHSYSDLDSFSFQELMAYRDMTGINLDLFDVEILKDIDYVKRSITNGATVEQVLKAFSWLE